MPAHWNSWKDWEEQRGKADACPRGRDTGKIKEEGRLTLHVESPLVGTGITHMQICWVFYWRLDQKPDTYAVWPKRDLRQERH